MVKSAFRRVSVRRAISLLFVTIMLLVLGGVALDYAQNAPPRARAVEFETGYAVKDPFLAFYEAEGRQTILGLPRSDVVIRNGVQVQFLDNAGLEWDPSVRRVRLYALGTALYHAPQTDAQAQQKDTNRAHPSSDLQVMPQFAAFYYTHGGAEFFGEPISDLVTIEGRSAQYYERARLDQIMVNGEPTVVMAPLGRDYVAQKQYVRPVLPVPVPGETQQPAPLCDPTIVSQPRLEIEVKHPSTGRGGYQTVQVRLIDVDSRGIDGIPIRITVHEREGDRLYVTERTRDGGYASLTYPIGSPPAGYPILVDGSAYWAGIEVKGRTSYTPWYERPSPSTGTPIVIQ